MCKNGEKIETFEDVLKLIFSNTVPKSTVVVGVRVTGREDENLDGRDEIFSLMTKKELDAYDTVEAFAYSKKSGLPEDEDSLESCIEHADWNNDDLRCDVVNILAEFEATVAYYSTIKDISPDESDTLEYWLGEVQHCIDDIIVQAREIELLFNLEKAVFEMIQATKAHDEEAYEEAVKNKYRFFSFGDAMFIK